MCWRVGEGMMPSAFCSRRCCCCVEPMIITNATQKKTKKRHEPTSAIRFASRGFRRRWIINRRFNKPKETPFDSAFRNRRRVVVRGDDGVTTLLESMPIDPTILFCPFSNDSKPPGPSWNRPDTSLVPLVVLRFAPPRLIVQNYSVPFQYLPRIDCEGSSIT